MEESKGCKERGVGERGENRRSDAAVTSKVMLTGPDGQLTEEEEEDGRRAISNGVLSLAGLTISLLMEGVWCLCLERDTLPPLMTGEVKGLNTYVPSNPVHCITCRVVHSCKLFIVVSIKVLVLWISCVDGSTETERDV